MSIRETTAKIINESPNTGTICKGIVGVAVGLGAISMVAISLLSLQQGKPFSDMLINFLKKIDPNTVCIALGSTGGTVLLYSIAKTWAAEEVKKKRRENNSPVMNNFQLQLHRQILWFRALNERK